jgi:uncharacterized membrane protein
MRGLARTADRTFVESMRQIEGRWVRWNLARTISSTTAFGCLVLALASNGAG